MAAPAEWPTQVRGRHFNCANSAISACRQQLQGSLSVTTLQSRDHRRVQRQASTLNSVEFDLLDVAVLSIQVGLHSFVNGLRASQGIREHLDQSRISCLALLTLILLNNLVELGLSFVRHVFTHPVECELAVVAVHALEEFSLGT